MDDGILQVFPLYSTEVAFVNHKLCKLFLSFRLNRDSHLIWQSCSLLFSLINSTSLVTVLISTWLFPRVNWVIKLSSGTTWIICPFNLNFHSNSCALIQPLHVV